MQPPDLRQGRRALVLFVLALVALLSAELAYFSVQTTRHYSPFWPQWTDQIQYLSEAYQGYEYARAHGFWPGVWQTLVNPSAQGTLHDFFALLVFRVVGPSRGAALFLNGLALVAWQAALAFAVGRGTGSRALSLAAAALPLALHWVWLGGPGSATDFRLDHFAMCALGVTLCVALLSDGFRSRPWSVACGFAVGITLLTRFLTGTYFVLICAATGVWVLCEPARRSRLLNLLLAVTIAAVIAGPVFWLNRSVIWNYYWVGHISGAESAIRDAHLRFRDSLRCVSYLFFFEQLGEFFLWVAGVGVAVLVTAVLVRRRPAGPASSLRSWWVLGAIFLLAPGLILTVHKQKSVVVLGALTPGAVVLVLAAWAELLLRQRTAWLPGALAAGIVVAAGGYFVTCQIGPAGDAQFAADAKELNAVADSIFERSLVAGLPHPYIGVDHITECLDARTLCVVCYERHGVWLPFATALPTGIFEEKDSVLLARLAASDFVCLTEDGPPPVYPYDSSMLALRPRCREWCDEHLRLAERFSLFGRHLALYQRPDIPFP
jgi:hypothetical protein